MPHKLGQVFLQDKNILKKIIDTASLTGHDSVIEIGCGEGVLSYPLAESSKRLDIIEIDSKWLEVTKDVLNEFSHVNYHHGDVLKTNFPVQGDEKVLIVANIPYYISAKIIKRFIHYVSDIKKAVVMVQDEFAKKLIAKPGEKDYTSLTVHASFYFDITYDFKVSRTCFKPVPDVDSAVISLVPKTSIPNDMNHDAFFNMVRSCFWGRRKPIRSVLKKTPYINLKKEAFDTNVMKKVGDLRGEKLSLEEFVSLHEGIKEFICD